MATLIWAIGLVLIVEGLVWVLAPSFLEQMLAALRDLPIPARRMMGLLALTLGTLCLAVAHWVGG